MADTILTARVSKPQFSAKNELNNIELWRGLAIIDVEIDSSAAVTDQPVVLANSKDAQTISTINEADMKAIKIIKPAMLRLSAIIPDLSMVESITQMFFDPTVTMSVSSKSIITEHLVMTSLEITQSPDMMSASQVAMTFEQAKPPASSGYQPEQPADTSMYGINIKQPQQVQYAGSLTKIINDALTRPPEPLPPGVLLDKDGGPFILNRSKLG